MELQHVLFARTHFPVTEFRTEKHFLELTGTLRLSEIYIHGNNEEAKGQSGHWNWKTKSLMTLLNSQGSASGESQQQNTFFWLSAGSSASNSYTIIVCGHEKG
jgi:hypothetical protein